MPSSKGHRLDSLGTRRRAGGISVQELARRANVTDEIVQWLESGDSCDPPVTERLLDALGPSVTVTASANGNPAELTTGAHTFVTGDVIDIAGHAGSNPAINGAQTVVSVRDATHVHINANLTSFGAGGTARLSPTALGIARL